MPENDNYAQEGKPVAPEGASVNTDSMIWNAKSLQSVVKKLEWASISGIPISEIEKYNIQSFQPTESEQAGWDGVTFAQKTVEKYFSTPSDSAPVNIAKRVFLESLGKLSAAASQSPISTELIPSLQQGYRMPHSRFAA